MNSPNSSKKVNKLHSCTVHSHISCGFQPTDFVINCIFFQIGLDNLFANSADFSDFTQDRIKLDDVYYAAVIDVKEGGIDADGIDGMFIFQYFKKKHETNVRYQIFHTSR